MTTNDAETRPSIGPVQVGVVLLALATAIIHLYLFFIEGFLGDGRMLPWYQILFVLNFLGYVTLAAALYLPISLLARLRPAIRVLLIAMSIASVVSYFYVNARDTLGDITQIIVVLLIVAVTIDAGMARPREELAGR